MTQALYAHMNNKKKVKRKGKRVVKLHGFDTKQMG
jgi:hypothetical protein